MADVAAATIARSEEADDGVFMAQRLIVGNFFL